MSDQPKPTTGEWTVEGTSVLTDVDEENGFERYYFHCTNELNAKRAADAHNAALAEREELKRLRIGNQEMYSELRLLEKQNAELRLATNYRTDLKDGLPEVIDYIAIESEIQQLRAQLDAAETSYKSADHRCGYLCEQLASGREKVQTYEGALIKIANDPNCDRCQVAVDALAKVAK